MDLALAGAVGAAPPYAADAHPLRAVDEPRPLPPRGRSRPFPRRSRLVASGEVRLRGPLRDARPRSGRRPSSPTCSSSCPSFPVRAREPVRLTFSGGRLELADLHLAGEGTDLAVTGGVDVLGEGPLALSARGQADLRALSLVTRRLRGTGAARLAVDVSGHPRGAPRPGHPRPRGRRPARARLPPRRRGTAGPRALHRARGRARGRERDPGRRAGSRSRGRPPTPGGRLTSYDIRPTGRGLALRYPEGLRSLLDAELRLFGDAGKQWITGTVDVRQALYTKRYDVASELLGARRVLPQPEAASLEEGAQLDLRVRAPGHACASTTTSPPSPRAPTSRIQGTTRAPVVTGRAEIERGRLYFQGRTYVIQQRRPRLRRTPSGSTRSSTSRPRPASGPTA